MGRLEEKQQETLARAKYNSNVNPLADKPGPIDTLILGDSILKYVDRVRHAQVLSFPGISCLELAQLIIRDKIKQMHGKRVIVIHCGTNDLDQPWETTVYWVTHLLVAISDRYPDTKLVWSTILPREARTRKYNAEEVRLNIIKVNNAMKRRQRQLQFFVIPSHTSFHKGKFPYSKLFARDFLHLKPKGTFCLRELYRQHLVRLRSQWGIRTWPVNEIEDPETIIDRKWLSQLCNNASKK